MNLAFVSISFSIQWYFRWVQLDFSHIGTSYVRILTGHTRCGPDPTDASSAGMKRASLRLPFEIFNTARMLHGTSSLYAYRNVPGPGQTFAPLFRPRRQHSKRGFVGDASKDTGLACRLIRANLCRPPQRSEVINLRIRYASPRGGERGSYEERHVVRPQRRTRIIIVVRLILTYPHVCVVHTFETRVCVYDVFTSV